MKIKEEVFSTVEIDRIMELKTKAAELVWEKVPAGIGEMGILAGGCFASWYHHEKPKDHDIFFLDTPEIHDWKNSEFDYINAKKQSNYVKNPNIIDLYEYKGYDNLLQLIFTKYKTREELMNSFDYEHTKVSFVRNKNVAITGTLYTTKDAIQSIANKSLVRTNSPHTSPQRLAKFIARGWKLSDGWKLSGIQAGPVCPQDYHQWKTNIDISSKNPGTWTTSNVPSEQQYQELLLKIKAQKDLETLRNFQEKGEVEEKAKDKNWHEILVEKLKRPWDNI